MIHYHGLPITSSSVCIEAISGGHAFVSFAHKSQLNLAVELCQSFAVDNGAFSAWKSGKAVTDWSKYYEWVSSVKMIPSFDFAVIPDVIDGNENDNDALLQDFPFPNYIGAPVWHMHESLERLERMANEYPRICIGSSAEFSSVGGSVWKKRMHQAMEKITDQFGRPICKIHGLRMLNPKVFTQYPLSSADSTSLGRNVNIDKNWKGTYNPISRENRARILRTRIETHNSPAVWNQKIKECEQQDDIVNNQQILQNCFLFEE